MQKTRKEDEEIVKKKAMQLYEFLYKEKRWYDEKFVTQRNYKRHQTLQRNQRRPVEKQNTLQVPRRLSMQKTKTYDSFKQLVDNDNGNDSSSDSGDDIKLKSDLKSQNSIDKQLQINISIQKENEIKQQQQSKQIQKQLVKNKKSRRFQNRKYYQRTNPNFYNPYNIKKKPVNRFVDYKVKRSLPIIQEESLIVKQFQMNLYKKNKKFYHRRSLQKQNAYSNQTSFKRKKIKQKINLTFNDNQSEKSSWGNYSLSGYSQYQKVQRKKHEQEMKWLKKCYTPKSKNILGRKRIVKKQQPQPQPTVVSVQKEEVQQSPRIKLSSTKKSKISKRSQQKSSTIMSGSYYSSSHSKTVASSYSPINPSLIGIQSMQFNKEIQVDYHGMEDNDEYAGESDDIVICDESEIPQQKAETQQKEEEEEEEYVDPKQIEINSQNKSIADIIQFSRNVDGELLLEEETDYQIEKQNSLGKGGQAEVYKMRFTNIEDVVAIKMMAEKTKEQINEKYKLLKKEYKMIKDRFGENNANIIKYIGLIRPKKIKGNKIKRDWYQCGLVMECLDDNLAELCGENQLEQEDILDYMKQMVQLLKIIHQEKVMHRDFNPKNIMSSKKTTKNRKGKKRKKLKLIDFTTSAQDYNKIGLARTVLGTSPYQAPEVNQGKYSDKADIWSLGCSIIHLITGQTPRVSRSFKSQKSEKSTPDPFKNINEEQQLKIQEFDKILKKKQLRDT